MNLPSPRLVGAVLTAFGLATILFRHRLAALDDTRFDARTRRDQTMWGQRSWWVPAALGAGLIAAGLIYGVLAGVWFQVGVSVAPASILIARGLERRRGGRRQLSPAASAVAFAGLGCVIAALGVYIFFARID